MPRSSKAKASATGVAKSATGQARARARQIAQANRFRKARRGGNARSNAVRSTGTGTTRRSY